jgi:hypothetical protein
MQQQAAAFQTAAAANPMLRNPFDFSTEQLLSSDLVHNISLSLSDQPSWRPVAPFTNEHLHISLGNYVRGNLSWPSKILRHAEDGLGSPGILTTDGEHWRAVFIDGPAKTVFYWDPLYEAYFGPGNVPGAFRNAFTSQGWVHKQLKMRVQSDGFQCGVWVSVFQQIVLQYRWCGAEVRGLAFEAFFRRKLASEGVFLFVTIVLG